MFMVMINIYNNWNDSIGIPSETYKIEAYKYVGLVKVFIMHAFCYRSGKFETIFFIFCRDKATLIRESHFNLIASDTATTQWHNFGWDGPKFYMWATQVPVLQKWQNDAATHSDSTYPNLTLYYLFHTLYTYIKEAISARTEALRISIVSNTLHRSILKDSQIRLKSYFSSQQKGKHKI